MSTVPKFFIQTIADGSVTAQKLSAQSVITNKILDEAVTPPKLATGVTYDFSASSLTAAAPVLSSEVATKLYVDSAIGAHSPEIYKFVVDPSGVGTNLTIASAVAAAEAIIDQANAISAEIWIKPGHYIENLTFASKSMEGLTLLTDEANGRAGTMGIPQGLVGSNVVITGVHTINSASIDPTANRIPFFGLRIMGVTFLTDPGATVEPVFDVTPTVSPNQVIRLTFKGCSRRESTFVTPSNSTTFFRFYQNSATPGIYDDVEVTFDRCYISGGWPNGSFPVDPYSAAPGEYYQSGAIYMDSPDGFQLNIRDSSISGESALMVPVTPGVSVRTEGALNIVGGYLSAVYAGGDLTVMVRDTVIGSSFDPDYLWFENVPVPTLNRASVVLAEDVIFTAINTTFDAPIGVGIDANSAAIADDSAGPVGNTAILRNCFFGLDPSFTGMRAGVDPSFASASDFMGQTSTQATWLSENPAGERVVGANNQDRSLPGVVASGAMCVGVTNKITAATYLVDTDTAGPADYIVAVDPTSNTVIISLPSAALTLRGRKLVVTDEGGAAATNLIGVSPDGADTINGATDVAGPVYALEIVADYGTVTLMCDGVSNWVVLSVT